MKELLHEYFFIPKNETIREKVMLTRITSTVLIVVLCLVAMSVSAYAYFSYDVTSNVNIIKAANFEAKVLIDKGEIATIRNGRLQTADLPAGEHTIELTKGESTTQTGFCIVSVDGIDYYTSQIGMDVEKGEPDASVAFTLIVSKNTSVQILSHWGTSSCYRSNDGNSNVLYIQNGDTIKPVAATDKNSSSNSPQSTTGETKPENSSSETNKEPSSGTTPPVQATSPETTQPDGEASPPETPQPDGETTPSTAPQPDGEPISSSSENTTESESFNG